MDNLNYKNEIDMYLFFFNTSYFHLACKGTCKKLDCLLLVKKKKKLNIPKS